MDRQSGHIASVIPRARAAGLTHLLHIDDDELVYCPSGPRALLAELASAPAGKPDVHLCNVEALLDSTDCSSPFLEARAFRHFPTRYCSYTNGKSFGKLSDAGLQAHGPHHFRCAAGAGGALSPFTHAVPPHVGVVLHYESVWTHSPPPPLSPRCEARRPLPFAFPSQV